MITPNELLFHDVCRDTWFTRPRLWKFIIFLLGFSIRNSLYRFVVWSSTGGKILNNSSLVSLRWQIDTGIKIKTLFNSIWEWKKNLHKDWGDGVKNKVHTADCLQQLSQVLWVPVTRTNCNSRSRDDREFPLRAVAVVYERATSLAAGDPIRQGS